MDSSASSSKAVSSLPVSCFIIARDEADRIGRTIDSVSDWVSEVVVVISNPADPTVEESRRHGAHVVFRDWDGYGPQKRFGEENCRENWLLNLDADEVVTPDLADEIRALFATGAPAKPGYYIRLPTVYPGRDRPRPFAHSYNCVRLYDKRKMRYCDSLVHDRVDAGAHRLGQCKAKALHFSYRSIEHLSSKLDAYFSLQAKELRKPLGLTLVRLPFEYPLLFLRDLFIRRHIFGGLLGARIAHVIAWQRTRRLWKLIVARLSSSGADRSRRPS